MLDKCATVDEAVALLEQYDMHSSANSCYHFQIADASGETVVVEYIGNEMSVLEPGDETTAAPLSRDARIWRDELPAHGPATTTSVAVRDRYAILADGLTAADGVLSEDAAMDLLSAVAQGAAHQQPR